MPGASDVKAGGAYVVIGGRSKELQKSLGKARGMLTSFGRSVSAIGGQLMKAGAMMGAPLAIGVKLAADFSKEMANVATMLSEETMGFLPGFSNEVRKMSVGFGESTSTLSKGLYDILSASIPAENAVATLGSAMKAAAAGMTDGGVAADALTTILNSYGLSAEKAGDVSDWYFSIVKRGKTTFPELAQGIGQVASVAKAANLDLNELGAALSSMTRSGVKTDIALTALRGILTTFLSPARENIEAAQKLGFELNSQTLASEGLTGVLEKLRGKTADQVAAVFSNVRALSGLMPLLGDYKGFLQDIEGQTTRTGATQDAFGKVSATLGFKMAQVKQSFLDLGRAIGLALTPNVKVAIDAVAKWAETASNWVATNKEVLIDIGKLVRSLLVLGLVLKGIAVAMTILGGMAIPIGVAVAAVLALVDAFTDVDTGFSGLVSNIRIGGFKMKTYFSSIVAAVLIAWAWLTKSIENHIASWSYAYLAFAKKMMEGVDWLVGKFLGKLNWLIKQANKLPWIDIKPVRDSFSGIESTLESLDKKSEAIWSHMQKREKDYQAEVARLREKETQLYIDDAEERSKKLDKISAKRRVEERAAAIVRPYGLEVEEKPTAPKVEVPVPKIEPEMAGTVGTFSAAVAAQMVGTGTVEKQLQEQKKANELLAAIKDNTEQQQGAVFQ